MIPCMNEATMDPPAKAEHGVEDRADGVRESLEGASLEAFEIGRIEAGRRGCTVRGSEGAWNSAEDWSATHNA